MSKKDLIDQAKEEDFGADPANFYHPKKGMVDRCYSLRGGYIRDFEFDPTGYQLPADYLANQDKLYQWSLYVAREALRDSGYLEDKRLLAQCGLVLGNLSFPTASSHRFLSETYTEITEAALQKLLQDPELRIPSHNKSKPKNEIPGITPSQMVSTALGLSENHYAIDAACASSLYAIKLACDDLITGKSDMMLAGAVCASDQLFIHMGFSIFHAYAPTDEKFVPLDVNSSGLVSSEGAGMVVLKHLSDAERDKDDILGVIGGIGLSNDGRGKFLLSPNPKGQRLAFERAYDRAQVSPRQTTYLECHATGTPLGDATEINSIADFFLPYEVKPLLGSVKSNMGHLLTAAGMTGLLKVLQALQTGEIPPNLHLQESVVSQNKWIGEAQMITEPTKWSGRTKQAGINSFGFGGTNAHMVVHNHVKKKGKSHPHSSVEMAPMAIIGMDAHFGDCTGLDEFYATIYRGKQHFRPLPPMRWKGFDEQESLLKRYGFESGKAPNGAYIEDFEFDLLRYKIQPQEAETLEPQQALILKVADHAIRDSGLEEGQNAAVIIAMEPELAIHHYLARWDVSWQLDEALQKKETGLDKKQVEELKELCKNSLYARKGKQTPSQHTSFVGNIMASRIAALWDFSGPAFTISEGNNSVLKALQIAQNMLSLDEVDAVVVGGVDFSGGFENVLLRNKSNPINQNPNPGLSISQNESGWLVGEGAGAVVLKKQTELTKARSYATIETIGQPHKAHQADYLELAATGIQAQDDTELQSLLKKKPSTPVALGSVKTNIGHTYAASGIASLIKTSLCLHHRFIPSTPNWDSPKEVSSFNESNYYFPLKSRPWILQHGKTRRLAAINGPGEMQIQLSEGDRKIPEDGGFLITQSPHLIAIGGDSESDINTQLLELSQSLTPSTDLSELGRQYYETFQEKKSTYCLTLLCSDVAGLKREIKFFRTQISAAFTNKKTLKTPAGSYFTPSPLGTKGKVAMVYPGSSTAYAGLGRDLFQLFPGLYSYFETLNVELEHSLWPDYLYPKQVASENGTSPIYNNAIAMMSVGVFYSASLTHILQSYFKLDPDTAFGYSMGECSSMWYALGVWSADESQEFQNSPIFKNRFAGNLEALAQHWKVSTEEAQERWTSLVLLAPKARVEELVNREKLVYLTFINTDMEVVISGDKKACQKIADTLGCPTVAIPFQNIIHHDFCKVENEGLLRMHKFPLQKFPKIDFYSSISQSKLELESHIIAENSTAVCCQQVDFPSTVKTVSEDGANIFVEMGPNATCTHWIQTILSGQEHVAVSVNHKGKSDAQSLVEALGQLLSHGISVDLSPLYPKKVTTSESRHFFTKIVPGGKRIYDMFLTEENKRRFRKTETKQLVEVISSENTFSYEGQERSKIDNQVLAAPNISTQTHSSKESNVSMQTKSLSNNRLTPAERPRLGENGLILQDYSSGEHLAGKQIVFSQQDLETFATGKIADVFGSEYAVIDTYRRRVMLPMHPYLLVSRVTGLDGTLGVYQPSTMQTEYDIPYDAWFTTDRQIPWAVSVESGQCDLLLISYLGIDFQNKGELVYRLLDCTLTFVDDLPFEGQTLRYDISINSFVQNADNLLFFFSYRCYVQDRLVLKMDGGCAGFFTDEQLEEGKGVVYTESEQAKRNAAEKKFFSPLLTTTKTAFTKEDLLHLINGDLEKCFGDESYYANGRNPSLRLPPERILMLDRITSVDLTGGAYGLGYIVAEKDLHPDDWYFPCHFRDDEVLAGSLQAEGGGNLLRFFMLMLGLQRLTKDARYQPVFDLPQKVRCRKQVTPRDTKLIYKLEIKEIGLIPNPYVIGDLEIISDNVVTVHFENLGLQLREKSKPKYLEKTPGIPISQRSAGALLNEADITIFALDDLSKCFGPEFSIYNGRKASRQPNTDLQLISRVISIDGTRGNLGKPSSIVTEYDVPDDAWYYQQNSNYSMPYSILMEVALQPCGLMGAYLGSTLQFPDKDLFFRNLDGEGTLLGLPKGTDFRGQTITNRSVMVSSVALGGTILQNYTFELSVEGQVFYRGKSSFGFFPENALATQAGLDNGTEIPPWYKSEKLTDADYMQINLDSLYGRMKLFKAPEGKPHYRLAENQLHLLDKVIVARNQGKHGLGYIHATKFIKKYDWFFYCHFYQDPVMPGSLGIESILQAMQVFALQQDLGKDFQSPKFVQLQDNKCCWKYRGQILMDVKEMHLEIHIKKIEHFANQMSIIADAYLWNDKMRIYQVTDLGLGIEES